MAILALLSSKEIISKARASLTPVAAEDSMNVPFAPVEARRTPMAAEIKSAAVLDRIVEARRGGKSKWKFRCVPVISIARSVVPVWADIAKPG